MRPVVRPAHARRTAILSHFALVTLSIAFVPVKLNGAPQEEKQEEEPVVVEPPELEETYVRSPEPVCLRASTVVCEDFEKPKRSAWSDYEDKNLYVDNDLAYGGKQSLKQTYEREQAIAGWLGWYFGDHPEAKLRSGERFEEIYFRFYHRFQKKWPEEGFPPKFVRIRSRLADGGLRYAWEEQLLISARLPNGTPISRPISSMAEPAGVVHNGDGKLRWLDSEPLDLHLTERTGEWLVIEMRVKLNTPGQNDGRITYWVDGKTVLDRNGLNLRGAYTATTINNAVLEGYWNGGSPRGGLRRWFDNVVLSTEPVGCAIFTVKKKELDDQSRWQVQVATRAEESAIIWDSGLIEGAGTDIDVAEATGTFAEGADRCLLRSTAYVIRARHAVGVTWSEWTEWSPMFER